MRGVPLRSVMLFLATSGLAAESAPVIREGTRLQTFVEGSRYYASLPRLAHKPDFRLERVEEEQYSKTYWWIMDGGQQIGLLNLAIGEIEIFRFLPPAGGSPVAYKMPPVHNWSTLQGPRITIMTQGTWSGKGEMAGLTNRGAELHLCYREELDTNTLVVQNFTLRFDAALGYIWDCVFEMHADKPREYEYSNLLVNGLADSRDARKRYQKCLWLRQDGTLCYLYQNPRSLMQSFGPEWTRIPTNGGFVGFVAETDFNPFLEILQSIPETRFVTCSVWYDQHLIAMAPQRSSEDGRYHTKAVYRLLNLPLPVAKELEDAARTMLPAAAGKGPMGFRQGIVNDFETLVPAGTLYNGCIWGHSAKYDENCGHSGTHSLRLQNNEVAQPVHGGPRLHVTPGSRYRLRAWVRTRGVAAPGAYIRVKNDEKATASQCSARLTGDNDWTQLTIDFKPDAQDSFVVPGLVVEGAGAAWFDDIELTELP